MPLIRPSFLPNFHQRQQHHLRGLLIGKAAAPPPRQVQQTLMRKIHAPQTSPRQRLHPTILAQKLSARIQRPQPQARTQQIHAQQSGALHPAMPINIWDFAANPSKKKKIPHHRRPSRTRQEHPRAITGPLRPVQKLLQRRRSLPLTRTLLNNVESVRSARSIIFLNRTANGQSRHWREGTSLGKITRRKTSVDGTW